MSFMEWQLKRGVLNPLSSAPPGSPWWRAVNERLLRDSCTGVGLEAGAGRRSPTVELWSEFVAQPSARGWYRAHNASIVAAYLEHEELAWAESEAERFFLNVVLLRVLYAHALVAAPRLSLGRFAPLGRLLGDPRLGMAGAFLSLGRILPDRYPADDEVDIYLEAELGFGRLLDYAVIGARLPELYGWSARETGQPGLADLIRGDAPVYAWPYENRRVWRARRDTPTMRLLRRATSPRPG